MVTLRVGDDLELGGLAGPHETELFARLFEIDNGDTVMARTHIATGNSERFNLLRTFETEIVDILYLPGQGLLCLSGRGALHRYSGGVWSVLSDQIQPPARVSQLVLTDNTLFAIGPTTGAYRFVEAGGWLRLPLPEEDVHILDMALLDNGALMLCGTDGYLASFDGSTTTRIDLMTDLHLCGVWGAKSEIWVCGYGAQLFHFASGGWELLDPMGNESEFLQFLPFKDKLLMAAESEILEILPDGPVPFSEVENRRLAVIGDTLFCWTPYNAFRVGEDGWDEVVVEFDLPIEPDATARPRG